ncbi:WhiB family transcriptional regulator [Streptomyces sp. YJ-C3]
MILPHTPYTIPAPDTLAPAESWQDHAACRRPEHLDDRDLFFNTGHADAAYVRRICDGCPVRVECLEYALNRDEQWGTWGGLSTRQRKSLLRQRRRDAPPESTAA